MARPARPAAGATWDQAQPRPHSHALVPEADHALHDRVLPRLLLLPLQGDGHAAAMSWAETETQAPAQPPRTRTPLTMTPPPLLPLPVPPQRVTASRPAGKVREWCHFRLPARGSGSPCRSRAAAGLAPPVTAPPVTAVPAPSRASGEGQGRAGSGGGNGSPGARELHPGRPAELGRPRGVVARPGHGGSGGSRVAGLPARGARAGGHPGAAPGRPGATAAGGGHPWSAGAGVAGAPGERAGLALPAPRRPTGFSFGFVVPFPWRCRGTGGTSGGLGAGARGKAAGFGGAAESRLVQAGGGATAPGVPLFPLLLCSVELAGCGGLQPTFLSLLGWYALKN